MTFLTKQSLFALVALAAACAAIGGAWWFVSTVDADRTALANLAQSYADAAQRNAAATSLRISLRDSTGLRQQLAAVTQGYDPLAIIRAIENAGSAAGISLTVNNVSPSDPSTDDSALASYLVTASATGTFQKLYDFVALAETLPFPSEITHMKLEKIDKDWQLQIVIRAYSDQSTS